MLFILLVVVLVVVRISLRTIPLHSQTLISPSTILLSGRLHKHPRLSVVHSFSDHLVWKVLAKRELFLASEESFFLEVCWRVSRDVSVCGESGGVYIRLYIFYSCVKLDTHPFKNPICILREIMIIRSDTDIKSKCQKCNFPPLEATYSIVKKYVLWGKPVSPSYQTNLPILNPTSLPKRVSHKNLDHRSKTHSPITNAKGPLYIIIPTPVSLQI